MSTKPPNQRSLLEVPQGVTFIHQYYPGFIDLPTNGYLLVKSDDLEGIVHILSHIRPLIVGDFDNEIVRKELPDGRMHTDIRRPILSIDLNAIAADATGHEGRSGPAVVAEHAVRGRVACQDVYTELLVGAEYYDQARMQNLMPHSQLIERFLGAYRYVHPDPRVEIGTSIPDEMTPMRIGFYQYSILPVRPNLEVNRRLR